MDRGSILLFLIALFFIIYFAVRLAIAPLINKQEQNTFENNDSGLYKLRDIQVFDNAELYDIQKIYRDKGLRDTNKKQYEKYVKVLMELKEIGYLTSESYDAKLNLLNKHYNIE